MGLVQVKCLQFPEASSLIPNIVDMQFLEQKQEANDLIKDFEVFKIPFMSNI